MNQKFIIKFEKGIYEQTYKLSELDIIGGINGVFKIIDDDFISHVVQRFRAMKVDFNEAYTRSENA